MTSLCSFLIIHPEVKEMRMKKGTLEICLRVIQNVRFVIAPDLIRCQVTTHVRVWLLNLINISIFQTADWNDIDVIFSFVSIIACSSQDHKERGSIHFICIYFIFHFD